MKKKVVNTVENCLNFLEEIGVEPPIYGFLTLDNVEGYSMSYDRMIADGMIENVIRRDRLETPKFTVEDYSENVASILEKPLGRVWQACDFPDGSLNYENGGWKLDD